LVLAIAGNNREKTQPMRILPVSSGKGGVGKTTFALNLALSLAKTHQTVLIDLDTGTSSLRNFLDVPVDKPCRRPWTRIGPLPISTSLHCLKISKKLFFFNQRP